MTTDLSVAAQTRYRFIRELIRADLTPPARVVEFGAAPGDQIAALAEDGYQTTAVDIGIASDEWADGTSGRMTQLFSDAGVRFVEWDLEQTPYPLADQSFDAVVCTEVFEHLRDYPVTCLQEAYRVLRPGGRLYLTTPNAAYLANRARLMLGRSVATPLDDWIAGVPHARHAREYTVAEMVRLIDVVGLKPVTVTGRHFHLDGGGPSKRVLKRGIDTLATMRPSLGPCIVVVAERPTGL